MATINIRNLDESIKAQLRVQAARHGHSMEEEVRLILRRSLNPGEGEKGLGSRIRARFSGSGNGEDLALPSREEAPRAPDL
ncbi:FitA-like ribbon-helix-helix domain-containing protein [Vreelandella utahensis]|uniref:FitA-like ribbon-helix-helix domain-containing protein n=1 Tax=Vreelandella halophila TaxID=86177 RepID=UPI00098589D9|nr:plasmid stabilization protein [Halomonas utahensis]